MRAVIRIPALAAVAVLTAGVVLAGAPAAIAAWTAAATATFTQSSTIVPAVTFTSCSTNNGGGSAALTWADAPATVNGSGIKDYLIEWDYVAGGSIQSSTSTQPTTVLARSGLTGDSIVRVTARYLNGWNTLVPTSYPMTTRTGQNRPQCNPDF